MCRARHATLGPESPMKIIAVASFAPIVRDPATSQAFYGRALGLPFEGRDGPYVFTSRLDGCHHFGLWPLAMAAVSCFGTQEWPADVLVPQACLEFEVESVAAVGEAAAELEVGGHRLLRGAVEEPWGQTVARLLSPEGLLVGVSYAPALHAAAAPPADA